MNLSDITFCIKTIHRPESCARLVRSILKHCPEPPKIHVVDDGKPEYRFKTRFPDAAELCDRVIETDYDIGLSAGRNLLLDTVKTPKVIFTDDDHEVTVKTRLPELVRKLNRHHDIDLLAAMSGDREGPRMMRSNGHTLRIFPGAYHWDEGIGWCHYVGNCFVAYTDILQGIRWDESLKMEEHWDFFWRAKVAGLCCGVATDHVFAHNHVDPPEYVRHRPGYARAAMDKHGIKRVKYGRKQ